MNKKLYTETIEQSNKLYSLECLECKTIRTPYDNLMHVENRDDGSKTCFYIRGQRTVSADGNTENNDTSPIYENSCSIVKIMPFGGMLVVIKLFRGNNYIYIYDTDLKSEKILCENVSNFDIDDDLLVCVDMARSGDVKIYDKLFNKVSMIKCNNIRYNYIINRGNSTFYAYSSQRKCIDIIDIDGTCTNDSIQFLTYGNERITFQNVRAFHRLKLSNYLMMINNNQQLLIINPENFHVVLFRDLNESVRTVRNLGDDCFDVHYSDVSCLKIERFRFSMKKNVVPSMHVGASVDIGVNIGTEVNIDIEEKTSTEVKTQY